MAAAPGDLERLKNLAVALSGAGAACCGLTLRSARLRPRRPGAPPLHLAFFEHAGPCAQRALVVVALPELWGDGSSSSSSSSSSSRGNVSESVAHAAALWLVEGVHFLLSGGALLAGQQPSPLEPLDAVLRDSFERILAAFERSPAAAAAAMLLGPPQMRLAPHVSARVAACLAPLARVAPPWVFGDDAGGAGPAAPAAPSCCLFSG
ncbi:hypothetical protein MNEG_14159, partial [Monoraphidium neglectum]